MQTCIQVLTVWIVWLQKKIHTHWPWKVIGEEILSKGGRGGVLKVKILEAEYEAKLEFPGGWEVQYKKNLPWGEYGSGTAHYSKSQMWQVTEQGYLMLFIDRLSHQLQLK